MSKKHSIMKYKQTKILIGCSLALVIIYIIGCVYFHNRFMFNTYVNNIDVSAMNYQDSNTTLKQQFTNQTLEIQFIDNQKETLTDNDCGITYNEQSDLKKIINQQNSFLWFIHLFSDTHLTVDNLLTVDENQLTTATSSLKHMQKDMMVAPKDAKVEYKDKDFSIVEEQFGSQINQEVFNDLVFDSFKQKDLQLNVKEEKGYNEPKLTSDDDNIKQLLELAKEHCNASIIYQTVYGKVNLDGNDIIQWLSIDEKGQYYYSEEEFEKKATEFVKDLAKKINIKSKAITFKGTNGTKTVSGGNYGYTLKQEKEVEGLLEDIKNHKYGTRQPVVNGVQASYSNGGLGDTFVEIDMTKQHFWFHKNGEIVVESDVVTGLPTPDRITPEGVYYVYFMQRDRVLRGQIQADGKPEYETPVAYWMAFNKGIGLHDATWQPKFGGEVYKTRGSHGCINLPKNIAAKLYDELKVNVPVVCYY